MKNRISITLLVFIFAFGFQYSSQAQVECPLTIYKDSNGSPKCIRLTFETPIAQLPNPPIPAFDLEGNGTNYSYLSPPVDAYTAIYKRPSAQNCNNSSYVYPFEGSILIPGGQVCTYTNGVLPIILTELKTKVVGSSIVLTCKYESTGEEGSVMVERSDDLANWENITRLDTDYTRNNNSFTYKDENPSKGLNYYKVSVVDEDGLLISEEVTNAYFSGAGDISLYPNPVKDILVVKNSGKESIKEVVIFDQYGRKIKVLKGDVDKIDFTSYPQGMYHIRATLKNGQTIQQNIVK